MNNSRLIKTCKTLNRKEMTRFKDLALSPYHNRHQDVINLIQYLSGCYPDFSAKKLEDTLLAKQLWPNEKFNKSKLKHVFSYATRLMEVFLKLEETRDNDFLFETGVLKSYRKRKLDQRYESTITKLDQALKANPYRNSEYHFNMLGLKTEADKYYLNQQKYLRDESLQDRVKHLDLYFLSEKLKSSCEMINREKFFNMNYDHRFLKETIEHIEAQLDYYQQYPSISFYYQVYLSLTDDKETKHYYKLREMIEQSGEAFPPEERRDLYYYAYNYCLRKLNRGDATFLAESFELMKNLLDQGLLLENDTLSEWHYKNMTALALGLDEYDWTHNFIEKYRALLPEDVAENAYTFNLASYYYGTKQYDEALVLLNEVEYTDVVYNLDAKSLLLRIYYDLDESDSLYSLIDAFKKYLMRNKLIAENKYARYLNLFKYANQAFKLKSQVDYQQKDKSRKELAQLRESLDNQKRVANKRWLKLKLDDIRL